MSLLANAFLCTFPDPRSAAKSQQQQEKDEGVEDEEQKVPLFTFVGLYDKLQKSAKNPT